MDASFIDQLTSLFGEFGAVEVWDIAHKRFRSNNSPLSRTVVEYLI